MASRHCSAAPLWPSDEAGCRPWRHASASDRPARPSLAGRSAGRAAVARKRPASPTYNRRHSRFPIRGPVPPRPPAVAMSDVSLEAARRRTFAIISHPDAGKTTLTEKLLLFGGAIQMAGSVKGRKAARHATSDWMALEKERGISVTSSVMQFPYEGRIVNLLDTPGHADFGEDTYRVLTAVDSALMVIDVAKGVEERTIKLMEVCRLRDTPIMTFINKLDREGKNPIDLLDEVESVLKHPVRAHHLADRHGPAPEGRGAPGHRRGAPVRTGPQLHAPGFDHLPVHRRPGAGSARRHADAAGTARRAGTGGRRLASVRPGQIPGGRTDAGVLRLGGQQLRRAAAAGLLRRPRAVAETARDHRRAKSARTSPSSPASCSRSRPTWIRSTATAWRSCACARASSAPA